MKIIFLDIDGVMNRLGQKEEERTKERYNGVIGMEPAMVQQFNELVERTGAEVVLSSSWRLTDDWRADMKANGFDFEFLDRTPHLTYAERGEEVDAWINKFLSDANNELDAYAILDDEDDFYPRQHLVQTDNNKGLTEENIKAVEAYLV